MEEKKNIETNSNNKKSFPLVLNTDGKEELCLQKLRASKDNVEFVWLKMNHVNLNFVREAYSIVGDCLRIIPMYGQDRSKYSEDGWPTYPMYTFQEIEKCEHTFDIYTNSTKESYGRDGELKTLSPLERYIANYIIVTRIAKFNNLRSENDQHISRSAYEIMLRKANNDLVYYVCTGAVNLDRSFLYRSDIKETSEVEYLYKKRDKNSEFGGHSRMLVHMVDPKYNVDGIYMSDPTANLLEFDSFFDHMLMSHDELAYADRRSSNPEMYVIDYNKEGEGSNELFNWSIKGDVNLDVPKEMFYRPIPKQTLIYAYLAVEHFLNRDMKMVNDPSEYNGLELYEAAMTFGFEKEANEFLDKVYQDGIKMNLNDVSKYNPAAVREFCLRINSELNKRIQDSELCTYKIVFDQSSNKFVLNAKYMDINYKILISKTIYELKEKPLVEQINTIENVCKRFTDEYSKMCGNIEENRVK